ncbi:MAG: acyl-CoA carboxylase subunit beta [Clostridia bacterium]|nr:acyl-CoA carboxylase subunit beta [Clostridia bacterium]
MWQQDAIDKIEAKRTAARMGGGEARIEKQHAQGKLTARERLAFLFDPGTFQEMGAWIESRCMDFGMEKKRVPGDGVVTGYGEIGGRLVFASSQDFTVSGGAGGEEYAYKICDALQMAIDARAPFIMLNDSGGARIQEGIASLAGFSKLFALNTLASGLIPQIVAIMGPCAGGASYSPAICDFIFMVDKTSQMYLTGPQVIKSVTGEDVTVEALGGAAVHASKSGVAHFVYPDDESCLSGVKRLLTYLPQSCEQAPANVPGKPMDLCRGLPEVVVENHRLGYDVRAVIGAFVDKRSFFEVHKDFAMNIVVGLARMDGDTVGVVANQPRYLGGSLDYHAADKAARFIRFCDCFNIPLITLVDVPGFLPGKEQEYAGAIRHGAKMPYAFSEATVPKICLILRKAYGGGFGAMNGKSMSADVVYAWPIAQIAVMGAAGAVNIIFRKQIQEAADPEAERARLIAEYEQTFMNPYVAAARGFVDEVIHPEETRARLAGALRMLKNKKVQRPPKKHGNMPL